MYLLWFPFSDAYENAKFLCEQYYLVAPDLQVECRNCKLPHRFGSSSEASSLKFIQIETQWDIECESELTECLLCLVRSVVRMVWSLQLMF